MNPITSLISFAFLMVFAFVITEIGAFLVIVMIEFMFVFTFFTISRYQDNQLSDDYCSRCSRLSVVESTRKKIYLDGSSVSETEGLCEKHFNKLTNGMFT